MVLGLHWETCIQAMEAAAVDNSPASFDVHHQQTKEQLEMDLLLNATPFLCPDYCPENNSLPLYQPLVSHNHFDYSNSSVGKAKKVNASAQSVAARERRRKITEKTQELGRLFPGGTKMNTADMLHAAFKYVKFLQAQVGLLTSLCDHDYEYDGEVQQLMHLLLPSAAVQEKLYMEAKCLVPTSFVTNFTT